MSEKRFYSIAEVGRITGVKPHVLRYWETEFPQLRPRKIGAGKRTYEKQDIELILKIKELLYGELYTIAGAKKKLEGVSPHGSGKEVVKFALSKVREELASILEMLEVD